MIRTAALLCGVALAALALAPIPPVMIGTTQRGATPAQRPRLIVLLVIDQFRADYVDWYGEQWTGGLHRLFSEGAVFRRATLPYAVTKTCTGHASLSTGTLPSTHGLIDNDWFDAQQKSFVACTDDPGATSIAFGGGRGTEHHSAMRLMAPTFADELRRQAPTPPRIVALALKARAAITLGGRGGAGSVIFWEEDSGRWATSSAFTSSPWPEVDEYITTHPAISAQGSAWNRLLPADRYRFDDAAPGELSGGRFPHRLAAPTGVPFASVWDMSPWSDAYLTELALSLSSRFGLGTRDATDFLAVGFSALDYVGHAYGPRSHEVQDTLVRLDAGIGRLLTQLDETVGRDRYVVALGSDHGVALLPEQAATVEGVPGGRLNPATVARAVETTLRVQLGLRPFVEAITSTYVHFRPGVLDELRARPDVMKSVETAALAVAGVDKVYWASDLASESPTVDATLTAMRRSYFAGRSGDLAFLPRAHWVVASGGTNHGSPHAYDREVPIALAGAGIRPGRYEGATPLDIVPTLAALAGIAMPRADGVARKEILAR